MRTLSDLQKRILTAEFPNMNFESDSDVERYFELRQMGRQADALNLYNTRLRRKFPDDAQRSLLIRYYRSHDYRYREILRDNMVALAERVLSRTTGIITLLTRDIDTVDMTDAYSVIKLAEGLLSIISPDRYQAIAFTEKYVRYAKILDYRHAQMERTAELIRLYVTDTIESVQDLKKEHDERRKQRVRQQKDRNAQATFDLSKVVFSPSDVARIMIPKTIIRTEDIVIAYCLKYWNLAFDIAFEKTIFLYSRKYHTKHNEIFQAIKTGRAHGWKDEEILNAVLANVVTGYYYNISGDLYLQRTWKRFQLYLQGDATTDPQVSVNNGIQILAHNSEAAIPQSRPVVESRTREVDTLSMIAQKAHPSSRAIKQSRVEASRSERIAAIQRVRNAMPARDQQTASRPAAVAPTPVSGLTTGILTSAPVPKQEAPKSRVFLPGEKKAKVMPKAPATAFRQQKTEAARVNAESTARTPAFMPNSIADIIRKMTGKTYTVYKELFFKGIRPSIRAVLGSASGKKGSLFGNRQNDAEEIIYNFLFEHYNDPYQNWKESAERKTRDASFVQTSSLK
jgi:hypothetical protein